VNELRASYGIISLTALIAGRAKGGSVGWFFAKAMMMIILVNCFDVKAFAPQKKRKR
jgi:hypothetical protein